MRFLAVFAATFVFATTAQAHSGHDSSIAAWSHNLMHAIGGADHTLALVSVAILFLLIALVPLFGKKLARSLATAWSLLSQRSSNRG